MTAAATALAPAWTGAASINDYALRLTPEEVRRLADQLNAVITRRAADQPPASLPRAANSSACCSTSYRSRSGRRDRTGHCPLGHRRFVGLTVLRWLPVGLTAPVTVLLAQSRGLSLADIGLLFTLHSVLVVLLELPTGGAADVLGRRSVVVAGAALHLLSCLAFALAQTLPTFCFAIVLLAIGRALDSRPLEAWYVDTVHVLDAKADVAPELAKQSAADGAGLAVGAVVGGLLPGVLGSGGATALALPHLAAALRGLLYVAAVLPLMHKARPPREGSVSAELRADERAVPATVSDAVRLSVSDRPLRLVLLLTAIGGGGLLAFELLAPLRLSELAGGPEEEPPSSARCSARPSALQHSGRCSPRRCDGS